MRRACVKRGCGTSCLSISGLRFSLHASPRDPAVICLAPGCVSGGKCGAWCLSQFCIVGAPFRGSKCINLPRSNSFDLIYANFVVKPVSINLFLQTSSHQTYMNQSCLSFYPEAGPISTLYTNLSLSLLYLCSRELSSNILFFMALHPTRQLKKWDEVRLSGHRPTFSLQGLPLWLLFYIHSGRQGSDPCLQTLCCGPRANLWRFHSMWAMRFRRTPGGVAGPSRVGG